MGNEQQQATAYIEEVVIRPVYGKGFKILVRMPNGIADEEFLSTSVAKFKKQLKKLIDEVVTDHVKALK